MENSWIFCLAFICIVTIAAAGCTAQQSASSTGKSLASQVTTAPQAIAHSGGSGVPVYVRMRENSFDPSFLEIKKGTTVVWTNEDAIAHTVTYMGEGAKLFDSGSLAKGETFSNTFNTPGRYKYACTQHSSMTGTIVVE